MQQLRALRLVGTALTPPLSSTTRRSSTRRSISISTIQLNTLVQISGERYLSLDSRNTYASRSS